MQPLRGGCPRGHTRRLDEQRGALATMATIRIARRERYTSIDRRSINDERLTFKALGLLVWLLDKPDDWRIDSEAIAARRKEGRDAVRAALKELDTFGYLVRRKVQVEGGRWATECTIFEVPNAQVTPATGYPASGGPASVNPTVGRPDRRSTRPSEDQALETENGNRALLPKTETEDGVPTVVPLALVPAAPTPVDRVDAVFAAWIESTHRTARTVLSPKRRRLIKLALDAYPIEDVLDAVRGWQFSEFHAGQNPGHKVFDDIELILRDAEHVERFRDFARGARDAGPQVTNETWKTLRAMQQQREGNGA